MCLARAACAPLLAAALASVAAAGEIYVKAGASGDGSSETNAYGTVRQAAPVFQPFDPHQHESLSHQPSADVKEEHVLTVVRTGYSLNGRLLRPAAVVVSSGPAKSKEAKG